ncbi:MAG: major capsid protein [Microviridae sp.]|nr:MAG: major capsid protein [Microviridae sp.]
MKNLLNSIKLQTPKSNKFDLTHDVKMSGKMGLLYPIMNMECVPGDRFTIGADSLIRFAPLIAPVMHRMDVTIHYFFVPNRILWENWEEFITNHNSGLDAPYITISDGLTDTVKKFFTYFGIPFNDGGSDANVLAFSMAAYQAIYNEYYRDQNLITEVDYALVDGDNTSNTDLFTQRLRAWEHDYFTACLPWAQKGGGVDIPLGDVVLKDTWNEIDPPFFITEGGAIPDGNLVNANNGGGNGAVNVSGPVLVGPTAYDPNGTLTVGSTTINDLRRAYKLQEWLEKAARGGSRYIESILTHFGVRSSDARLQRPEYITGIKSPVIISEVLNTTGADGGLPQGNMAGHAVNVNTGKYGSYFCEEHGIIMGMLSITPKTAYQQGIPRMFSKFDSMDYYWPSFAHLGEQEVLQKELTAYLGGDDNDVFGYMPRYAEYKYMSSRVAGDFQSTLNYWHLGRIFDNGTQPHLNQDFIECSPDDCNRIFAVQDGSDTLYMHILNKVTAIRRMPIFGTPSF